MKKSINLIAAILVALFSFTSCDKDASIEAPTETASSSEDLQLAQNLMQDAEDEADEQIDIALMSISTTTTCPTRTLSEPVGTFPNTLTIDYGEDGCEGPGGRIRKGQIVITLSAPLADEGSVRTLTFVDFFIEEAQIEGTKTLVNEGYDTEGNVSINRTVAGGLISFPDDTDIELESNHNLVQIAGADTPNLLFDNVYEITGTSSGENRMEKQYTSEVITPLIKKKNCKWLVAGEKELIVEGNILAVKYGLGNCDNLAKVTGPNGNSKIVQIKPWW